MRFVALLLALALAACSSAPQPAAKTDESAPKVKDDTGLLPLAGRTNARVVPDHLLGIKSLPGGSIADYDDHGKKYQLFVIETDSNQKAAFMITDLRDALKNPEYISYMGGYYGEHDGAPVYGFAKLRYIAGVVGLPKDEADPIARRLAARLQ